MQTISKIFGFLFLAAVFLIFTSVLNIRSIADVRQTQFSRGTEPLSRNINIASTDSLRSNLSSSFLFSKDDIDFKPLTQIPEQKCDPIASQPLKKVASFRNYEHTNKTLTELTTIHGVSETPLAICKYVMKGGHFAHIMQHLYMCYTFWQDNLPRVPVLYIMGRNGKEKVNQIFSENPFLKGFIELLTSQLKVEIFTDEEIIDWLKANMTKSDTFLSSTENSTNMSYFRFHEMRTPTGYVLSHVDTLNQMAQYFFIGGGNTNQPSVDYDNDATVCSSPRIGILNRRLASGRSIINAEYLVKNITSEILKGSDIILSSSPPVSLTFFETKSFKEQVLFFHNIDLLISPHGAQLTGIPFLGNKPCTQMVEFFPDHYLMPDYYGTLARDSDVEYSYIYTSNSSADLVEQAQNRSGLGRISPPNKSKRIFARKQNLCISPAVFVDTLRDAIRSWCKCNNIT